MAEFYDQLGTMVQAGVPIQKALISLRRTSPPAMRQHVGALADAVNAGNPLHQAIARWPDQFAALDRQTLSVSEQSGALDVGLFALSQYYDARAKARKKIMSASLFPLLLLIATVFISHFPQLVLGQLGQSTYGLVNYAVDTVGFLIVLVATGLILSWIGKRLLRIPSLALPMARALRAIPVFGRVQFDYALSQWISSIRLMLKAGFAIYPALEYASRATPSPLITTAYEQFARSINDSLGVSAALQATGVFPDELIQFWATGEQSGRLDEMLDRLAQHYEERWRQGLEQLAAWLPRLAYGLVAVFIIFQIGKLLAPVVATYQELLR